MSTFGWVADRCEPPRRWDLRRAGWSLLASWQAGERLHLIDAGSAAAASWAAPEADRSGWIFLGVDCGRERARLLDSGSGDALPAAVALPELVQRARRVSAARRSTPRLREAGPLTLDLLHRDARRGQSWLSLLPREFELLWRLAERPGERVTRARLLREVWRLDFEPGTNSVEVHVSRLRAKLAAGGVEGLIETGPKGGYRLAPARGASEPRPAAPAEQRLCA